MGLFLLIFYLVLPGLTVFSYYLALADFFPLEIASFTTFESVAGVFLYYWFFNGIITGSRVRWLERIVGLPGIIRLHILNATGCMVWLTAHFIFKGIRLSLQSSLGFFAGVIMSLLILSATLQWVDTPLTDILIRIPFIRRFHQASHQKYQYQTQRKIHNFMILAGILAFIHVQLSSMAETDIRTRLATMGFFLFATFSYMWHKIFLPLYLKRKARWKLKEVRKESDQVTTLIFDPPDSGFSYKAGQFAYLNFISGSLKGEEHPFSLSSHPGGSHISFTIQDEGDFTHKLSTQAISGDLAIVDGPYGKFYPQKKHREKPLLFFAGGIGIAPFLGILEEYRNNPPQKPVSMFWLVNPQRNFLGSKMDRYKSIPNLSIGEFSRSQNRALVLAEIPDLEKSEVFICASKSLTRNIKEMLCNAGKSSRHIHYELFSM